MISRSLIGTSLTLLHVWWSLSAGCVPIEEDEPGVGDQPSLLISDEHEVINGERSSAHPLSAREYRSFAWLHPADSPAEVTCSGVFITPRHLLTAAHCLDPYQSSRRGLRFGVGVGLSPIGGSDRAYARPQRALQHPDLDLALVTLRSTRGRAERAPTGL